MPGKMQDVVAQMGRFYNISIMRKIVYIFAAMVFAGNFADEWTNSVTVNCITRRGLKKYIISNAVMCFVSSAILVFTGIVLFARVYSFVLPLYKNDYGIPTEPPYGQFLDAGLPFVKIILEALVYAVSCGFWSLVGMTVSAAFPNKYVSICAPVAMNFILERITSLYPAEINLRSVALSYLHWNSAVGQFLYSIAFYVLLGVITAFIFALLVKRRVQNEIN